MCGMGSIGQSASPALPVQKDTTQVAGATGGGAAAPAGDIASMLEQIAKSIEALRQALTGAGSIVGGGHGGGDMAGCPMQGGVDGANGGVDQVGQEPIQKEVEQHHGGGDVAGDSGPGKGKDSEVDGDSGPGKGKDSEVDGDSGPGKGKDSEVDGESGGGKVEDPSQSDPKLQDLKAAQGAFDAAKADHTTKAAAVDTATTAVAGAKGKVADAEKAVEAAATKRNVANKDLRDAERALADANETRGSYGVKAGDTMASIAAKFGISVDRLKELNPSVLKTKDGKLSADQKLTLPKGIGHHAVKARNDLEAAKTGFAAAQKAFEDAIAAQRAAREALKAAEAALEAAKKAADAAKKALEAAREALQKAKEAVEQKDAA